MDIVKVHISELNMAEYNPRKDLKPNDPEYIKLKNSIDYFGYVDPVIVNKQGNVVVGGHQRLKVLKDLGYENIDVVYVDLNKTDEKALNIALNKISGEWDAEKLEDLIRDISLNTDFDVELTGFNLDEIETMFSGALDEVDEETDDNKDKKEIEEDEIIEDVKAVVKNGDIWKLGSHILICGDSTDEKTYKALMGNEKANLVFTDPPYGMKKEKDGVANDNLSFDELLEFNKLWIPLTFKYTKDNGSWYCWGIDEPLMDIYSNILKPMIKQNKITFRNLITWDKGSCPGQTGELARMYIRADEKCLFVMCGVQGVNNNSDNYFEGWEPIRNYLKSEADKVGLDYKKCKEITGTSNYNHWFTKSQWTLIPEEHYKKIQNYYANAFNQDYDELKREYYKTRAYFDNTHDNMNNVWSFNRTAGMEREEAGGHATPKPLALCARAIKTSSRENETVLDVFGGSGSTLIACEELGRQCRMIELEPHWCDVIINRWQNKTGKKAELIRNIYEGGAVNEGDIETPASI